ncbi:MAG: Ni/Fe-hydrogenase, b-type cytochrome subunit [Nitrospiraceae bacterium]|nr:Ni/Fe-hydrogenase, b-type cytochrome subunit [Nitrospiraceae bacterium]
MERKRTYIWEFPVRFTHWINFLAIILLSVTGLYIGSPFLHPRSGADYSYTMGWMRFLHYIAAYVFLMMIALRVYWAFAGNRYANWRVFFPFTRQQRHDLGDATRFYLFASKKPPYAAGHTACAGIAYLFLFVMFLWEIFSGFALYQVNDPAFFHLILGGWLLSLMNVQTIRFWHHLVLYFIWAFAILHVYIAVYLDQAEKNGLLGSIFGGYKFITGREWE